MKNFSSLDKKPGSRGSLADAGIVEKQAVIAGALCPSLSTKMRTAACNRRPKAFL